jgi:DNA-binding NarL/FixJ family response regulator
MKKQYRVILADDHVILREGIKRIIEESPDIQVIGEASDGLELLRLFNHARCDMVILDVSMPILRGIEATREIKKSQPSVKVLILTMHNKSDYIYNALAAGADGYLLKESSGDELKTAIETIRGGGTYVSKALTQDLTDDLVQFSRGAREPKRDQLTLREKEVLKLIVEGKTSSEIASLLFISIYTVNNHRANISKKLRIKKTADLVRYAIREGYISGEST